MPREEGQQLLQGNCFPSLSSKSGNLFLVLCLTILSVHHQPKVHSAREKTQMPPQRSGYDAVETCTSRSRGRADTISKTYVEGLILKEKSKEDPAPRGS